MLNCTFGADTLVTSAARVVFKCAVVTAGQEFKSNLIKDCTFIVNSSDNGVKCVAAVATSSIKFTNHFDNCVFMATINASSSSIAQTSCVTTPNGLVE